MYGKRSEYNVDKLKTILCDPLVESDVISLRKILKQVLTLQNNATDTSPLFPVVVKFIASNDIICKKIAHNFVRHHGTEQDLILLAINSLLKDCTDPSPMTRGLALRTLSDLPNQSDYSVPQILQALEDSSAYVRRIAVMACVKMHNENPELADQQGLVDALYNKIRDPDPVVVVNCLNGLEEMLQSEGGVVMNKNMAHYLLNNLKIFSDWSLVTVFTYLRKYSPEDEDEIYAIMNLVDKHLSSNSASVVTHTLDYFLFLTENLPHLKPDIFHQASGQILHVLGLGHPELNFALLGVLEQKLGNPEYVKSLQAEYQSFYCRQSDPVFVKERKMAILPRLISSDNESDISAELALQCCDNDEHVAKVAIKALGKMMSMSKTLLDAIMPKLCNLMNKQNQVLTSEILQVLQFADLSSYKEKDSVLKHVQQCLYLVTDVPGKCAILAMLGEHGENLEEAPYIVESFVDNASSESEETLLCELMTCVVKIFVCRPAETQEMLGRLLELCHEDNRIDVQERAKFYYSVLKTRDFERILGAKK